VRRCHAGPAVLWGGRAGGAGAPKKLFDCMATCWLWGL
jgi:hypothetical protein